MTDQIPAIRTADRDGDGPAKRRRRPALSCVECHSRKVRCDRNKPCGACTRVRSTTCTFRPQRAGVRSRSPALASASASGSNEEDHERSARSFPHSAAPTNEFDAMVNRHVAPGIFGEYGQPRLHPLPADRPSLRLNSRTAPEDSALIDTLLDRIRNLERQHGAPDSRPTATELPSRHDSGPGQFLKSKFYGQSHWMNAIEPVSQHPTLLLQLMRLYLFAY
jgi:hypothetical protein